MDIVTDDILQEQSPEANIEWRWCLVGNIVKEHPYGEEHIMRTGTRHFRPGTKVYCAPMNWGDYDKLVVIGHPRHGKMYIEVIMERKKIENFRLQKCFRPAVLNIMKKEHFTWWGNTEEDKNMIENYYLKYYCKPFSEWPADYKNNKL